MMNKDMKCLGLIMLVAGLVTVPFRSALAQNAGGWRLKDNIQLGVTAGTTGVGVEVALPLNQNVQVRAGGTVMPTFEKTMNFGVEVGLDPSSSAYYMDNIRSFMRSFINYDMKDNIDMVGKPRFANAKLMVDWSPLRNKNWHFTAGVYIGNATIAKAVNRIEDMTTLMGVNMYNELYRKGASREPMFTAGGVEVEIPDHFVNAMLVHYGEMAIHLGDFSHDVLATEDVYWDYDYYEYGTNRLVHAKGDLRCAKGDVLYHEGDAYRMRPNELNEVSARAKVNVVRPYLGAGYSGAVTKDGRLSLGVDMGLMMWGGSPSVVTHEGIDLVKDMRNVRGKVGDYVKLIKDVKAFPVVEMKVSYRL